MEMSYLGREREIEGGVLKEKVRLAKREVMMKLDFFPESHLCSSSQRGSALLLEEGRAHGSTRTAAGICWVHRNSDF